MMPRKKRRGVNRGERGQVLVLFVGLFTVLIALAAFSIDQGLWLGHRRIAQKDADAAVRAGAVPFVEAISAGDNPSTVFGDASDAALASAGLNSAPTPTSEQLTF